MRFLVAALPSLALGFVLGLLWDNTNSMARPDRHSRRPSSPPALDRSSDDLRAEIGRLRSAIDALSIRLVEPTIPESSSLPGVVILDVSDVKSAILVLEEYRYRGERRWWTHNLDRFVASARDFTAKNPHRKEWLESLERSQIDLRAVADAEAMEAWLSRYRQTFAGVPSNLLSRTGHIWRDWMSVRARK